MNMWNVILFFIILTLVNAAPDIRPRIANGTDAKEGEFKFAVSLRRNKGHVCGGSIINKRHILTAAHCVCNETGWPRDPEPYSIQYGSVKVSASNERSVPVSVIVCNKYTFHNLPLNDIAVLKLAQEIPDDGSWEPAKLLRSYDASHDNKGVINGWGLLGEGRPLSKTLQKLNVDIYNDTFCGERYVSNQHLCLGAAIGGACEADSGGSLTTLDHQQIGLLSFGTGSCDVANRKSPVVYARVDHYYSWIQEIAKL